MKLLWCCVIVAMMLTDSDGVDIEKTVTQVQNILKANEGLPRLSRDEIIQLLNDIRAEDAKSKSSSTENSKELSNTTPWIGENEINPITQLPDIRENIVHNNRDLKASASPPNTKYESVTKKGEPSVVVVLPYTPRDGSSLQELYTRPPRVEVIPVSKVTPTPLISSLEKLQQTLTKNSKTPQKPKDDLPAELQAFLEAHGLKGQPGQDNFLLPLEGFKPLPPAKIVDGTVQLPENILLTYDLLSPDDAKPAETKIPPTNFLYEPLRPEFPFELDTSQSENKEVVLPLPLPVRRTKSTVNKPLPNYEPIDYDSVKVIPLTKGISPLEDNKSDMNVEQNKRQADPSTISPTTTTSTTTTPATLESESNNVDLKASLVDAATADSETSDTGASIADLEDSFGGAAPVQPGDSELPPPRKNGFYWMLDWNSFLEVGDGDTKVNIHFEPKLGDPQMFIPVNVP
ncbi:unnamed protein product [Diatraea saccharalis]|uniref:Uncharacterized protein n=1 Tax=Diatraea saccharalis TaxID=40085 RepID=A0A9N9R1X3_9NEOP|nr:unnamed protein product [Diatraea saccharalis]